MTIRGVAVRTAETGAAGDFAFPDLPEGDYEISAELSGFERQGRAVRVRAGERVTVSFTLRVALVEKTIVTAAKAGGRDVQEIPIAITAVSQADLGRLGTQTIEGAPALAPSVTFSQNTGWGQLTIRGIGTQTFCLPDRIQVRRCISTVCTSPGRRWCSRGFSIWIASKCFVDRRAPCMDGTRSAGR